MTNAPSVRANPAVSSSTNFSRHVRAGFSLLELVMSVALMGGMLVPALELVRRGIELSSEVDQRQLLAGYASSQLEERLAIVAANWTNGTFSGDYSSDGLPNVRYQTTCSDAVADGGVVNTLMVITSTTYYDANGNDSLDADELNCSYQTKLGKFATYEELVL